MKRVSISQSIMAKILSSTVMLLTLFITRSLHQNMAKLIYYHSLYFKLKLIAFFDSTLSFKLDILIRLGTCNVDY